LASVFSVGYSLRFIADVFFGPPPTDLPSTPHEPPRWMRFPVEVLVFVCLIVGVIPSIVVRPILDTAAAAVLGPDMPAYSLALWHGFTLPVLMSIIAMVGGVDRKSTRLNSSHVKISYAVFCLKKKKIGQAMQTHRPTAHA